MKGKKSMNIGPELPDYSSPPASCGLCLPCPLLLWMSMSCAGFPFESSFLRPL